MNAVTLQQGIQYAEFDLTTLFFRKHLKSLKKSTELREITINQTKSISLRKSRHLILNKQNNMSSSQSPRKS